MVNPICNPAPDNLAAFLRALLSFLGGFCGSIGSCNLCGLHSNLAIPAPHGTGSIKGGSGLYGQFRNAYHSFYNGGGLQGQKILYDQFPIKIPLNIRLHAFYLTVYISFKANDYLAGCFYVTVQFTIDPKIGFGNDISLNFS